MLTVRFGVQTISDPLPVPPSQWHCFISLWHVIHTVYINSIQIHLIYIFNFLTGYFRFYTSLSSKERARSNGQKRLFHKKWSRKVLLEPCWYSTSFKRQQDSSTFRRWVWKYPVVEWRNIWWNRGTSEQQNRSLNYM